MSVKKQIKLSAPATTRSSWSRRFNVIGLGKEREYFVEHFSLLVSAGMDVVATLKAIQVGVNSKIMKQLVGEMKDDIEAGTPLWRALGTSNLFSAQIIALIRIGEEAGTLKQNLHVIVEQQQKDRLFRSKIRSAMMYPLFVLGLALVVGIGIAWFILPRLSMVFTGLNIKLPLITRILIGFGDFMRLHGVVAVPALLGVLGLIGYFLFVSKHTKFIGQEVLFHIPGINTLLQEIELARFGYILGTLLKAGLPVVISLKALTDATILRRYRRFYNHLLINIEDGNSFEKSFTSYNMANKLIPVPMQQLIVAGEQSGRLAEVIVDIGRVFEEKTETTAKNITVVLEPLLLVIVWLGVVVVALSVILPIYGLIGGLSQGNQVTTQSN